MRLFACLIVAPQRGYDEPATLSYAISSFCPTSADGLHMPTSAHRLARLREPSTSGSRKLKAASKPFEMLRLQWGIARGHLSRMCDEVIVKVSGSLGWSAGPAVPV